MSPEVSEEIDEEGDGGLSSWWEEPGVGWSNAPRLVRRRLDGGMIDEADGESPWLGSGLRPSWSDTSSEAMEERGEPGESVIGMVTDYFSAKGRLYMEIGELCILAANVVNRSRLK